MPRRVLQSAVDVGRELLHFFCEFFGLLGLGLVGCAGHRCGAAAGVQLTVLLQASVQVRCDTQDWSGLVCVASVIRAVADSPQLGA